MIPKTISAQECIKNLNLRSASLLLTLLLCGDLAFVVLHFINTLTATLDNPFLNISKDRGHPEIYQYIKYLLIIITLTLFSVRSSSLLYIGWISIFLYFLLDDSLRIHEQAGHFIAESFNFSPTFRLSPHDFGEIVASAVAGIVLMPPLILAYRKGSNVFRKISQDISLLILALIFFGVVVDIIHSASGLHWIVELILGAIEDGGEMLTASVILWYVFLIAVRDRNSDCYLCDCARIILTKRST